MDSFPSYLTPNQCQYSLTNCKAVLREKITEAIRQSYVNSNSVIRVNIPLAMRDGVDSDFISELSVLGWTVDAFGLSDDNAISADIYIKPKTN